MSNVKKVIKNVKVNWQSYLIVLLLIVLVGSIFTNNFFQISSSSISNQLAYDYSESEKRVSSGSSYYGGADDTIGIENRKVIKNGNVNLETDKYEYSKNSINNLVVNYNGIVLSDSESRNNNDNRYSNMRIKISSDNIDEFVNEVKLLGEVKSLNIYSNDVTGIYVDYSDRLNRYEEQIVKYELMLESEKITIEEEVQVQQRIDQLEDQIFYMKKSLGNLDEDVIYSEVYITLSEKPSLFEEVEFLGFKDMFKQFLGALNSGWNLLLNIVGFIVPFVVVYFIYRVIRRFTK